MSKKTAAIAPWARTAAQYRDELSRPVWGNRLGDVADDGGMGVVEWLNVDTGLRLLLIASGSWKTPPGGGESFGSTPAALQPAVPGTSGRND